MKIKNLQFKNVVSFGGQLQSASVNVVGDRPGATPMSIELDDSMRFFELIKSVNGIRTTKIVPMDNVASFEPLDEPKVEAKPAVKK